MKAKEIESEMLKISMGYSDYPTVMDEFGKFIFVRTYSRFLTDLGRRETWKEVVIRALTFNFQLASEFVTKEEIKDTFDRVFNLKVQTSGRNLWVGGTPVSKSNPMSLINCTFSKIESFEDIVEMFMLSMLGAGTATRLVGNDIAKLPKIRNKFKLSTIFMETKETKEFTEIRTIDDQTIKVVIGDSKEAWGQALKLFFEIHTSVLYRKVNKVIFDFSYIRKEGEPLKTFGGYAPGYKGIERMFVKLKMIFDNMLGDKLLPIDILDIVTIIGENVVSGGVRRTAMMILMNPDDNELLMAKDRVYEGENKIPNMKLIHRVMSNNSIMYDEKPSREQLAKQFKSIRTRNEPSFINMKNVHNRFPDADGVNACGEELLPSKGTCNLTAVDIALHVIKDSKGLDYIDYEDVKKSMEVATRIGVRNNMTEYEYQAWEDVKNKYNLVGVSITGITDTIEKVYDTIDQVKDLFTSLRKFAVDEGKAYSETVGRVTPATVTTCKPSGTTSLLAGNSAGLHNHWSPFYIRRVRISSTDPLLKVAKKAGYKIVDDNNGTNNKVIEFYIKKDIKEWRSSISVSAIDQLKLYVLFVNSYIDTNASVSISVGKDEWKEVEQFVFDHWDEIVGVSFVDKTEFTLPLMPYESITKEEYLDGIKHIRKMDFTELDDDSGDDFDIVTSECTGGSCPIK